MSVLSSSRATLRLPYYRKLRYVRHAFIGLLGFCSFFASALSCYAYDLGEIDVTDISYNPSRHTQLSWTLPGPLAPAPGYVPGPSDPTSVFAGYTYDSLVRSPSGTALPYTIDTTSSYSDTDWSFNTRYSYHIHGFECWWGWNSTANEWQLGATPIDWTSYYVTVRKVTATTHQTVDSRIDMRYSDYHLQDHKFKDTLYRGGLFAGYNADNSRVGRAYFKFVGLTGPLSGYSSEKLWGGGGLTVYCPRLARTGSADIICQAASSSSWDPDLLVWSNAPSLLDTPGSGASVTISWDSASPSGQWATFNNVADIERAVSLASGSYSGASLTSVLMSPHETTGTSSQDITASSNGWAYFARNSYTESSGPHASEDLSAVLLYAFGGQGLALGSVTLDSSSCYADDTVTGTVHLAYPAPSGGAVVSLSCDVSGVTIDSSVTIPAGYTSATFDIDTSGVTVMDDSVTATITAAYGRSRTATLTIYNPWW